jgi:hypothetical protein
MDIRYRKEVDAINNGIASFNLFLNLNHLVPAFRFDTMLNEQHCIKVVHGDWHAFSFPNSPKRGVYFIFGHEKTVQEKNGLYIGKASFGSSIGDRLYYRLHPYRSQTHFVMTGYDQETYVLDFMASIDLDSPGLSFMAPALEEFLISNLKSKLNLINGTGN